MSETQPEGICFVIAPIGDPESDLRRRSDLILHHIIRPCVTDFELEPIRSDQISEPGLITSQIVRHLVEDKLVVADVTDKNPNVFYEMAIRHAVQKPLVQIAADRGTLPFDVHDMRTIYVDITNLDSVDECKAQLSEQIRTSLSGSYLPSSPVARAIDIMALRQSDDAGARTNAQILSRLDRIESSFRGVRQESKLIAPATMDVLKGIAAKFSDLKYNIREATESAQKPLLDGLSDSFDDLMLAVLRVFHNEFSIRLSEVVVRHLLFNPDRILEY